MAFFTAWFRRKAIIKYRNRLSSALVKDYGKRETYFPEQVITTIHRARLSKKHSVYALAMFSTPEWSSSYCKLHGMPHSYEQCRQTVLDIISPGSDESDGKDLSFIIRDGGGSGASDFSGGDGGGFDG